MHLAVQPPIQAALHGHLAFAHILLCDSISSSVSAIKPIVASASAPRLIKLSLSNGSSLSSDSFSFVYSMLSSLSCISLSFSMLS